MIAKQTLTITGYAEFEFLALLVLSGEKILMHALLYIEDMRMNRNITNFDLFNVSIQYKNRNRNVSVCWAA